MVSTTLSKCVSSRAELAPSSPQRVSAHVISDVAVRVTWSQPDFYPDSVTGYRIYFEPASETGIHPYGVNYAASYDMI